MENVNVDMSNIRKAAIFCISVGEEAASKLYKLLKPDEIESLTAEIARIESIDRDMRTNVLTEFEELALAHKFFLEGGLEYARKILVRTFGHQKATALINSIAAKIHKSPFEFLQNVSAKNILTFIKTEHPQTIALLLSYLSPEKSSEILSELDPDVQADVSRRIALMDKTSPEIIRIAEQFLEKRLSNMVDNEYANPGGIDKIVEILHSCNRSTERNIIETLEDHDMQVANSIKQHLFVFEDIVNLDDRSMQEVVQQVDRQELALALKSVDENIREVIYDNLSHRSASYLRDEIEFLGPVRMSDVEEAQQKIVNLIRRLEANGDIIINRDNDEEIIV